MDTDNFDAFISRIPDFEALSNNPRHLLRYFGYFISELEKLPIRPVSVQQCFELARLDVPSNISRLMSQSLDFTKTRFGYQLHWKARQEVINQLTGINSRPVLSSVIVASSIATAKDRDVLVIYGRDEAVRRSIFQLLRALGLNPLEWGELVKLTGKASPHVWEVLDVAFTQTQIVIVVFTPDEKCELREQLRTEPDDFSPTHQPRPNVLIEAGIALAKNEDRTLLVHVGNIRAISDLSGRHVLRLNNSSESRNDFAERLQTAGCPVQRSGRDWLNSGDFDESVNQVHIISKN
jgi:predicted nucleotide-binding protein